MTEDNGYKYTLITRIHKTFKKNLKGMKFNLFRETV